MNALMLLTISVCFLKPTVGTLFPSTFWIDSTQEAAGGLLVTSKIIPPGFDELLTSYSKFDGGVPELHLDWPVFAPFGINLVFCSCKKFHPTQSFSRNGKYSEPDNLLWPSSRNVLLLTTPKEWWHNVEWASLWKNGTENCGCGVAMISSYVGRSSARPGTVSGERYDACLTSSAKNETSSIVIRPVWMKSEVSVLPPPSSSPSTPVVHYTLIEHAPSAGSSPACTNDYSDLKKNQWVTVWGVVCLIWDLPISIVRDRRRRATTTTTTSAVNFGGVLTAGGDYSPTFIRFYDFSDWKLEPITRSTSTSGFRFSSDVNTLFCLAVWVGSSSSEPAEKYKLTVWKNWKVAASAPVFIASASETENNWATKVKRTIIRSSLEFEVANNRDKVVTLFYAGFGFSMLMLPIVLLLCSIKNNKTKK